MPPMNARVSLGQPRHDSIEAAIEAAERAQARLTAAIDAMPHGVVFLDEEGRYILWNDTYAEIYAKSADLLEPGVRLADTLRIGVERGDYPEALGREDEWIAERLALLENPGVRHEQLISSGRTIMIEERKTSDGGTIGLRVDITDIKERERSFRFLFEDNPVPLLVYVPESGLVTSANDAALRYFGYTADDMTNLPAERLFAEGQWESAKLALSRESSDESCFWRHMTNDGRELESVIFSRHSTFEGQEVAIVSIFDVTERRRAEARMAYMAHHDELTGLPNRAYCRSRLREILSTDGAEVVIAMIDLDNFKATNDSYGHAVGDGLLAKAAKRMRHVIGPNGQLCRIGGDEFAVMFGATPIDRAEEICNRLIAAMAEPVFVGKHVLHVGATVGLASAPGDTSDAETLLRYADLALYAAKTNQRGTIRRFDPALDIAARERTELENDFREAVMGGHLAVYYQPLVNLESGKIDGYEALLRWNHERRGFVSPEVFIPLAEEMGLIDLVGRHVLATACADAASWPSDARVAVNVSPMQFKSGNLLTVVVQALASTGLPPSRLELEITEAVLIDEEQQTAATIHSIREMGVGVSMDDFGTGYSSLSYLLRYPFSKVKIDKSFILKLMADGDSRAIIKAIIGLGQSLGLSITAEGIEDAEVLEYLRAEGCTQGQGYYLGRPAPMAEMVQDVKARKAG